MHNKLTYSSLIKVIAALCTAIMCSTSPLQSQTSEVELIGMRKYPFSVLIGDQVLPSRDKQRLHLTGLSPGVLFLHIVFADTAVLPLRDTIELEGGMCYVYRLVLDQSLAGVFSSDDKFSRLIRGSGNRDQLFFRLKLLEVTKANQEYPANTMTGSDTVDPGVMVHSTGYHFIRQEPVAVDGSRSSSDSTHRDPEATRTTTPSLSGASGATEHNLTETQFSQLVQHLTGLRFEDERMKLLDQTVKHKGLTTQQLLILLGYFDFERSKVRIFKQYYSQLIDFGNHTTLYQVFDFSSTIDELKQWVDEQ
jgi:hypothetical protein